MSETLLDCLVKLIGQPRWWPHAARPDEKKGRFGGVAFIVIAGFFLFAMHAPFWSIPMETLPAHLCGAAIGMVSLIGNIGSFVGPYLMGAVQQWLASAAERPDA